MTVPHLEQISSPFLKSLTRWIVSWGQEVSFPSSWSDMIVIQKFSGAEKSTLQPAWWRCFLFGFRCFGCRRCLVLRWLRLLMFCLFSLLRLMPGSGSPLKVIVAVDGFSAVFAFSAVDACVWFCCPCFLRCWRLRLVLVFDPWGLCSQTLDSWHSWRRSGRRLADRRDVGRWALEFVNEVCMCWVIKANWTVTENALLYITSEVDSMWFSTHQNVLFGPIREKYTTTNQKTFYSDQ